MKLSGSQVLKSLRDIGWEHYCQARQTGWVLYLEGSTDLAILQAFAVKLEYPEAIDALKRAYVHYVGNNPKVSDDFLTPLFKDYFKRLGLYNVIDKKSQL